MSSRASSSLYDASDVSCPHIAGVFRHIESRKGRLPSSEELDRFGTNGLLALIHDAVGHLITPIHSVSKAVPILKQIADTLIQERALLEEVLTARKDGPVTALGHLGARKLEGVPSLPHETLATTERSRSDPYARGHRSARGRTTSRAFCSVALPARGMQMHTRTTALTHCPSCQARIIPTPREIKRWRKAAGLTQRQMGARLKITAAHVAYLENGKRSPSAALAKRYQKFILRCGQSRVGRSPDASTDSD